MPRLTRTIPTRLPRAARLAPLLALLLLPLYASAQEPSAGSSSAPVTAAIDQQVARRWQEAGVQPKAACDDRAFARRVYLDLAGRLPTPTELESAAAPGQRTALVDRLLAGPEYARHMRDVFDVVLMGRKTVQHAQRAPGRRRDAVAGGDYRGEWLDYLERCFAANRGWDRMLSEILLARSTGPEDRGAVWFLFDRQERYQEIAEAVSPAIFGVQVQCAQCHDHPLSHEIKQAHYWGLVAFFNRGKNKTVAGAPRVAESAVGGYARFANLAGESQPNLLRFLGAEEVPEPRPADGATEADMPELYAPAPEGAPAEEPRIPRFSRREQFVERVVRGNPLVARAAVNRFWALLMGRGLVHPVDKMDSLHPASHPELLDWLAQDFERAGFDVRRLVRGIVLSRPYQLDTRRSSASLPELFASGPEKPLPAESLYRSLLVAATGRADADQPELLAALAEAFPDIFPEESLSTLRQTLFLTNSPLVHRLLEARGENTAARLAAIADPAARVREMFRTAFARDPDGEELKEATAYLAARADRPALATSQLWWALLSGAEFRFNH